MTPLRVCLAGAAFTLRPRSADASLSLHPDYLPFLNATAPAEPGGSYEVSLSDETDWLPPRPTASIWDSFIWRLGTCADRTLLLEVRDLTQETYVPAATLTEDFSEGTIISRVRAPQPEYTLNYPEGQIILLNRLSFMQAGLVHSSALVVDGKGYLFCGQSGAGKTTIARIWKEAGYRLLCDDRNAVRVIKGKPWACSTPWHGEDPEVNAENVPLGGIFHLNQAPQNRLEEIPYAVAISRLFATSLAPFYIEAGTERVLDAYATALDSVPSYDLFFTPDARAIELCLSEVMQKV